MRILDPGHVYELNHLDGSGTEILTFVKREGDKYPGNVGSHEGTTLQEVLRACADRLSYVNNQKPCAESELSRELLLAAILLLEVRAARHHGHTLDIVDSLELTYTQPCSVCGHLKCEVDSHAKRRIEERRKYYDKKD